MFSLSDAQQYYLCISPVDMRKGFDTLSGVVRNTMQRDPLSGEVFIFINKPRNTIKLLHWERGGLVLYHKRLESGTIELPKYDEITELLEYTPGTLYVRRIIRPQYVSKRDEKGDGKIYIDNLPSLPLPKSNAGASLLAQLLVSKYVDHLPFHRQIAIFKRDNVPIAASTVNDWFFASTSLLVPLYEKLREVTLHSDYISVDESTIPVVDSEKSKSIKAYMWVVRANNKNLAFFHYDKDSRI